MWNCLNGVVICRLNTSVSTARTAWTFSGRAKNLADLNFAAFMDGTNSCIHHRQGPQIILAICLGNFSLDRCVAELVEERDSAGFRITLFVALWDRHESYRAEKSLPPGAPPDPTAVGPDVTLFALHPK